MPATDACIHVECGFGQECRGGSCVCSYQCPLSPPNTARVCGEDGVLYASDCHRQLAACEKGSPIPQMPLTHCHSAVAAVDDACRCHSLGSFGPNCDNDGNCRCRAGVGGAKCDHCLPGFWGLHLIAIGAQSCKRFVFYIITVLLVTTSLVSNRYLMILNHCCNFSMWMLCFWLVENRLRAVHWALSCSSMECHHGAKCVESAGGHPDCECPVHCDMEHLGLVANMSVCGSDGTTYENMCHLQQFACKHQLDLVPSSLGICSDESAEPRERNNRKKEFPPNVNECASTGSCESDGACKAGDEDCNCSINGEKQHGGQCRPDRGSILNLEMDGEQAYNIDHPNLNLHMNISVKLVPHSSNGAILYARGGQNVLVLRMEMRRIVAELNSKTLYSPRTVALGKNLTIGLLWSGNMVSLRVAGSARVLRVGIDDTPVSELWIGRPGKLSLKSLVSELVINGQAIAGKKLTLFSSMRSLYGGVVELNKGEYAQLLDFHQMPQEKLRVGMDVKPASEEGVLFFWRLSDGLNEGQSSSPTFIGLFLREARLHLVWNVGSGGLRSIRSLTALTRGSWNDVQFELSSSEASISVNGSAVSSHFPAAIDPLPITGESVYIGGVPDDSNLPSPLGNLSRAFAGAVKRLTVNETPFRMQKVE
ncbi:hypothetical protein Q1695_011484 [Nippostrongylus brasiliensis]|nr:hypothetical protein Q1695_011484 [Nippostrongylus brasiliensis]